MFIAIPAVSSIPDRIISVHPWYELYCIGYAAMLADGDNDERPYRTWKDAAVLHGYTAALLSCKTITKIIKILDLL